MTQVAKSVVSVGDELAFLVGFGKSYVIHKVTKITPSGRIKCGGYEINPDLSIRGSRGYSGPSCAKLVTEELRQRVRREFLSNKLSRAEWHKLRLDELEAAYAVLEKHTGESSKEVKQ